MDRLRHQGSLAVASGVLVAALLALLSPAAAESHPRSVGVAQARLGEDSLSLLLKMDARVLYDEAALGSPEDYDPEALVTDMGRSRVLHLVAKTTRVEAATGLCDRDAVKLFELTPSRQHLDLILVYRCTPPREFVEVEVKTLLEDTGHYYRGAFADRDGEVVRRKVKLSAPTFRFEVPGEAPPAPPVSADPEPPPTRAPVHHLPLLALLVACALTAPGHWLWRTTVGIGSIVVAQLVGPTLAAQLGAAATSWLVGGGALSVAAIAGVFPIARVKWGPWGLISVVPAVLLSVTTTNVGPFEFTVNDLGEPALPLATALAVVVFCVGLVAGDERAGRPWVGRAVGVAAIAAATLVVTAELAGWG